MDREVVAKFEEVKLMAENLYDINCGLLKLKTTLKGKTAGKAIMSFKYGLPVLEINLNINAINGTQEQRNHILNNTIPHEMAHIVNYLKPSTGKNHDRGWKNVCRRLGGDGQARYSSRAVGNISSSLNYEYNVNGATVTLGKVRHNRLQKGSTSYRYMGYKIKPEMWTGMV